MKKHVVVVVDAVFWHHHLPFSDKFKGGGGGRRGVFIQVKHLIFGMSAWYIIFYHLLIIILLTPKILFGNCRTEGAPSEKEVLSDTDQRPFLLLLDLVLFGNQIRFVMGIVLPLYKITTSLFTSSAWYSQANILVFCWRWNWSWHCSSLTHGLAVIFSKKPFCEWDKQIRIEISESDIGGLGFAI